MAVVRATRELYRLTANAAARIEREVRRAFDDWPSTARAAGVPRYEVQQLEAAIETER